MPGGLIAATVALTITIPTIELPQVVTGSNYTALVSGTTHLLAPLEQVVDAAPLVATDPITYADMVLANVTVLFSYFNYLDNLIPGLTSMALLLSAYLLVMLVKVILSVVMYVKQLVASWL